MSNTFKIVGVITVSNEYMSKFLGQDVCVLILDSNGKTDHNLGDD